MRPAVVEDILKRTNSEKCNVEKKKKNSESRESRRSPNEDVVKTFRDGTSRRAGKKLLRE